jgi:NADPH-dependent 2,4-dienoyl-CoA reductase/sulfur reductase-like enzyme/rhodanese-related sulfurtransferase
MEEAKVFPLQTLANHYILTTMTHKKILIIGGVAAGATAAARARRLDEHAEITLLEKGEYVSFANCGLPYYVSRDIVNRSSLLLQTPEGFFSRYRVDVRLGHEAVSIDAQAKRVKARTAEGEVEFAYDKLILGQGGNPIAPALPGANLSHVFQLWTVPDVDRIHQFIDEQKPARAVVVGAGFVGLEMVEALIKRGVQVSLVELAPQVMVQLDPEFASMVREDLEESGVQMHLGSALAEISEHEVTLGNGEKVPADLVLLSIGVRPELALVKNAGLVLGASGALLVNDFLQTSDEHIFAAGDMIEVTHKVHGKKMRMPLAGPANRQGRIAATNALGGKLAYRGAIGTSVVKLFEHVAASTGLSEKAAREALLDVGIAYVFKDHHAGYYPGAKPLALKIVYDKKTSRLLGGQAYGQEGVEKRVDVLATALQGCMTLEDLTELDLAYAPPFSSANDPVNLAGFIGQNHISGFSPLVTPLEALQAYETGEALILDVRTVGEQSKAPLDGVLHIPSDEVRDRLEEIPRTRPIHIVSKDGFLGHLVSRTLQAEGFAHVYNLAGGFAALRHFGG